MTRYRAHKEELSTVFGFALSGAFGMAPLPAVLYRCGSRFRHELAVFLYRSMFPMLVLHFLLAGIEGTLNGLAHYATPEYAGVFFNLVMIAWALLLAGSYGITSLAIGTVGGGVVRQVVRIPALT